MTDTFIEANQTIAKNLLAAGQRGQAMYHLGRAEHSDTDITSSKHRHPRTNMPLPWWGGYGPYGSSPDEGWGHINREAPEVFNRLPNLSKQRIYNKVRKAYQDLTGEYLDCYSLAPGW